MLPPLLRKAAGDAGFDLTLGSEAEWVRLGVSGVEGSVWVVPVSGGSLIALDSAFPLKDFRETTYTELPPPAGAAGVVRCATPAGLYDALRRVRVLLVQRPPAPEQRLRERLAAVGQTEASAVVKQRVGQDLFRELLLEYWSAR